MVRIEGEKIRDEILGGLKFPNKKFLGAVLVGKDSPSQKFLEHKKKIAEKLGVDFRVYDFPEEIQGDVLRREVRKIGEHRTCGGLLVQLPLPSHVERSRILNVIPTDKDVDVLSARAIGEFWVRGEILPPAVGVVEEIFNRQEINPEEKTIAILGLGFLVGKPIAAWLMGKAKELLLLDKDSDLKSIRLADIVISGVGEPNLFSAKHLADGAGVIDFGTSFVDQKLSGDFNPEGEIEKLSFHTPTPGGTGPILIAKLFENFAKLNHNQ